MGGLCIPQMAPHVRGMENHVHMALFNHTIQKGQHWPLEGEAQPQLPRAPENCYSSLARLQRTGHVWHKVLAPLGAN